MEVLATENRTRLDVSVLCVQLDHGLPEGLVGQLESLVERVRLAQGTAEAVQAFSWRPPEVVLLMVGANGQGVWFAYGVLRELDPDVPCLVLTPDKESVAEAAAMAPGAFFLAYPQQQRLLSGQLSLAAEQSRRQRNLQETLLLKRNMFERMPSPVVLVEHHGRNVAQANSSARDMGLYEGAQCPCELLPHIFYHPPWEKKGGAASGFLRGVQHAGRSWDVFATWMPNGQLMLSATDVSGRVQAETQLQHSQERLRGLVANSAVGLYIADLDGHYQMANPAMASILGFESPEQLMQEVRSLDEQVYVQQGRRQEMLQALQDGETVREWVSEVYGRDGDLLWIQESLTPVHDDSGQLCGCEGSVLDITERRYAEQGYRSALAMLRRTFDSISDAVLLIDLEQHIVLCNDGFAREFDQDKDSVAGAPLGRFLLGSGTGGQSRTLQQYLGSDKEYNFLLKGAHKDATYMTSMSPFQDETGAIMGAILIARNVDSISSIVDTVVAADA